MQSHQSTAFFKTKTSKPKITLKINNGKQEKSTNIFYLESASIDFDNGYDSSLYNGISSDFEIYTNLVHKKTNQKLAIQTLPIDYRIVVPIGYKALPNSELFMTLEAKNFDKELPIYLEDKKLKTFTKLNTKNSKYVFNTGDEKTNNTRFYLHTTHKSLSLNEFSFSDIVIYNTNNSLELSNLPVGKNTVELYSLLGKKVVTKNVNLQKESVSIHLKKGIYILKLITEKGTIDRKILIE